MNTQDQELIDEIMDESKVGQFDQAKLPEAPASANTRIKTKSGRQWQITMRTATVHDLIKQIDALDQLFDSKGWAVPQWQAEDVQAPKPEEKPCPTCGKGTLRKLKVKKAGANFGKEFWGCSDRNCKHFEWA